MLSKTHWQYGEAELNIELTIINHLSHNLLSFYPWLCWGALWLVTTSDLSLISVCTLSKQKWIFETVLSSLIFEVTSCESCPSWQITSWHQSKLVIHHKQTSSAQSVDPAMLSRQDTWLKLILMQESSSSSSVMTVIRLMIRWGQSLRTTLSHMAWLKDTYQGLELRQDHSPVNKKIWQLLSHSLSSHMHSTTNAFLYTSNRHGEVGLRTIWTWLGLITHANKCFTSPDPTVLSAPGCNYNKQLQNQVRSMTQHQKMFKPSSTALQLPEKVQQVTVYRVCGL